MNELSLREDLTYEVKKYGYRPTACTEFALANSPFIAILRKQKQMSETLFWLLETIKNKMKVPFEVRDRPRIV